MRSRRPVIAAVLAFAVLVGQWLAAAHEPDHALQAGAAHACAVCVYAHGASAGAVPVVPRLLLAGPTGAPERSEVASPLTAALRHHPIRGPPAFLA